VYFFAEWLRLATTFQVLYSLFLIARGNMYHCFLTLKYAFMFPSYVTRLVKREAVQEEVTVISVVLFSPST
jgi:hypothetical protein